jgi:hypothetical protein
MTRTAPTLTLNPTRRQTLLALLGSALLPACGGGTDLAGISSGGTGSFTTGVIVGLGSVIVNGIRFDDDTASVTANQAASSSAALQLGMVVRVQASAVTAAPLPGELATAQAIAIDHSSEWIGQVTSVDVAARRLTVLGQTVRVLPSTVFAEAAFDGSLERRFVEIDGFLIAVEGSLQATRIAVKPSPPDHYRLSGVVRNLTATTFTLGAAVIRHDGTTDKPSNLQNGLLVRVTLQTATNLVGEWIADEVRAEDFRDLIEDDDEAKIEGSITAFISSTRFSVNGIEIDASRIVSPSGLALGVRVEVTGTTSSGTVIAREVEIEDEDDIASQEYEFHGAVSALDVMSRRFVIRGYLVRYIDSPALGATRFELDGKVWADGLQVEVKARLDASGDLVATQVEAHD